MAVFGLCVCAEAKLHVYSVKAVDKKEGSGKGNWGKAGDEANAAGAALDPKGKLREGVARC